MQEMDILSARHRSWLCGRLVACVTSRHGKTQRGPHSTEEGQREQTRRPASMRASLDGKSLVESTGWSREDTAPKRWGYA